MTTIPKLEFGPRKQASTSSPVVYDVMLCGAKVGELRTAADREGYCTDPALAALGLVTSETKVADAKRDLNACWRAMTDAERKSIETIAPVAWARSVEPAAEAPPAAAPDPAPVEPAAEKPAGKLTQEWIDSEPGCSKGDGLNGLRLSFENGKNYYYLSVVKGRKKTLGNAKRGHPKWISLDEARDRACARLAGSPA